MVDLNTAIPLISVPIKFGILERLLGVIQFTVPKALFDVNENEENLSNISFDSNKQELFDNFTKYFA